MTRANRTNSSVASLPINSIMKLRNDGISLRIRLKEEGPVKTPADNSSSSNCLSDNEFGKIGVELVTKATLCAALMAVIAGSVAILVGL